MVDQNSTPAPTFSTAHVLGSPGTTVLGVGWLFNQVGAQLANGIPTSAAGWVGLALNVAVGAAAIFGKA